MVDQGVCLTAVPGSRGGHALFENNAFLKTMQDRFVKDHFFGHPFCPTPGQKGFFLASAPCPGSFRVRLANVPDSQDSPFEENPGLGVPCRFRGHTMCLTPYRVPKRAT